MKYEYKVVPFIGSIDEGQGADVAAHQLQSVISDYARDAWEFVQLGDVNIEVKPGCLGKFLGKKSEYIRFDQVIFRRSI